MTVAVVWHSARNWTRRSFFWSATTARGGCFDFIRYEPDKGAATASTKKRHKKMLPFVIFAPETSTLCYRAVYVLVGVFTLVFPRAWFSS